MLFSRDKEDDDDFFPNPNYKSNLASIFNNSTDSGNSSLTYTAPKQPKAQNKQLSSSTAKSSSSSSAVIVARTVQTFKMVDNAYQNQGKLGAVVMSSCVDKDTTYQLLLYRDKHTHMCIARINRDFKFHIQPKNYASFYDKLNGVWSILFASAMDLVDFALQVALARWKAGEPTTPLMTQDLWCPVSESIDCVAAPGDSVELTYTLHTIVTATEGVEESISVWVEVDDKGWKQVLVGVRPTSKRVAVLQPFMLGDLNPNEVVYNCPIVVKLTVIQVSKAPSKASTPSVASTNPPKDESIDQLPGLPRLSAAASVESSLSVQSPKSTKADIITRMARMGQALPFKTIAPTPSDSDETEEDQSGRLRASAPRPRARLHHATSTIVAAPPPLMPQPQLVGAVGTVGDVASTLPSPVPVMPHHMAMAQPYMVGNMYPSAHYADSQPQFNVFLSEVRTTNSELRMGITRLTDKVEALQSKFDSPEKHQTNQEVMSVMARLLENEQQLKEQLQTVLSSLQNPQVTSSSSASGAVPVLPTSATSSTNSVTSVVEPCRKCAQLEIAQERMSKLEEENEYLQTTTNAQKAALQNARLADQDQIKQIEELQKQLHDKDSLIEDLEKKTNSVAELQRIVLEKQSCIDKLEQAVKESEATKLEEVRRNLQEVMNPKPMVGEHVKKILNTVYRLVRMQFESQAKYDSAFILSVLAETIKTVTLEYLQNGDLPVFPVQQQPLRVDSNKSTEAGSVEDPSSTADQEQFMRRDQRSAVSVEAQLSTKPTSEPEFSTPLNTSVPSLHNDLSVLINNTDAFNAEESSTSVVVGKDSNIEIHQVPSTAVSSDDFSDVRRPQPPPPPVLDDEDNDDDWFNS